MQDVLSYLRKHQDQMLADLERLVKAESPTRNKELVDRCGRELRSLFRERLNLTAEIFPQKDTGDHFRVELGSQPNQLLILGHFDTVWEQGQLRYRVQDNRMYGPGVLDMKGGIVLAIWAVKAWLETGRSFGKKIVFLCNSDHEGLASCTSRPIIEREGLKSDAVLVPEASGPGGALKTARKGIMRYKVSVKGVSSHAGNHHEQGVSAIDEAAYQIIKLRSLTDYAKGTTVNVGTIRGGKGVNVVPDSCEFEVDVRFSDKSEAAKIDQFMKTLQTQISGASLSVSGGIMRPSMEKTEQTEKLFQLARRCGEQLGIEVTEKSVGGGSDGSFTAALGVPTLDGLGAVGEGPHAEHEHIYIDQLPVRAALFAGMLGSLSHHQD